MKKKIKVKLKNGLRTEQKVVRFLIGISVISLILSALVELFSEPDFPTHWDYIKNILLGISGSSIISFVCVILPYRRNVSAQISNIIEKLIDIYIFYLKYHLYFKRLSSGENVSDNYVTDIEIYKDVDKISKKINNLSKEYNNSDFDSDNIANIINMLNDDMLSWLYIVKNFYEVLLCKIIEKDDEDILFNIKKDHQYLIKEKVYFTILLNYLDKILSESKIIELFSKINISQVDATMNDFHNTSMDLVDKMNAYNIIRKNSDILFNMNSEMINVLNEWSTLNYNEYKKINKEFEEILNNENFDLNKHSELVGKIYSNLDEMNFEKAEKNIKALKKAVEEDNQ